MGANIRELGIKAFTMTEIDRYGMGSVMDQALFHLDPYKNRPLHLSFDIDSVDPIYAPATGTRVMGGLSFREAHFMAETLAATGQLCSMDMMEVNPGIGDS